jgi:uncharacterized repeat protein (TIGR02543 family)
MLDSCSFSDWNADLPSFVEEGMSTAYLTSASYVQGNGATNADVTHGIPVTVTLTVENPKSLELAYSLNVDTAYMADAAVPTMANTASATDGVTRASFVFTPSEAAEHNDIPFTLTLSAPSINKSFASKTFTVRCDGVPDPVNDLVAGITSGRMACIGFTLPESGTDSDITAVEITYTSSTAGTSKTVTESVSQTGSGLTTVPTPALLDSDAGLYARYFIPTDVVSGNQYTFTVVSVDASGKRSTAATDPASVSVTGNEIILSYDANGGTGSVAAKFGYNGMTTVTVSSASSLARSHYSFNGWNTAADGTGTAYAAGSSFTFGPSDTTLYAQWLALGTVGVTVTLTDPSYESMSLTASGTSAQRTSIITVKPESGTIATSGSSWSWYVDGSKISGATSSTLSWDTSSASIGSHTVTGLAVYGGVTYSGSIVIAVTAPYTVSYNGTGNTSGTAPGAQTYVSGETVTLTTVDTSTFVKSGYSFAGWATSSGGTVAYANGTTTAALTASLTLYAVWANVAPDAVTGLLATADDMKVTLTWTDPAVTATANGDIFYIKISNSDDSTVYAKVGVGVQTCTIKDLTNGTLYRFYVTVRDKDNYSSASVTVNARPVAP